MLWEILTATRDIGRVHQIASVLVRHGFVDLVRRLGLATALEAAGRRLHLHRTAELARLEPAQRWRRVLEELGPTFIKLGQLLATRVDLFPPDWIAEFERLQDEVTPVPFEKLEARLVEDLGAPLQEVFGSVEREPLGSASLAQVHRATTKDGLPIVLKIRRPGVTKTVNSDLRLLARVAELAEAEIEDAWRYRPVQVCRQLERTLKSELDFAKEAHNSERIARSLPADSCIHVPKIYWQWTGPRLNVQEYIDGIAGRNVEAAREAGRDLRVIARRGGQEMLRMVLDEGFFHADPHPGNVFYLPGDHLGLIDFGMVGRLSVRRRRELADFLFALVDRDAEDVAELIGDWSVNGDIEPRSLLDSVEVFLDQYHGLPLKDLRITAMLTDFTRILREHDLALPSDLAMFFRVLMTLEGFGRLLDPGFDIVTEIRPFLARVLQQRYSPRAMAQRMQRGARRVVDVVTGLPEDLHNLLRAARRGQLQVRIEINRLDRFTRDMDRSANRITIGLVTAALIIGTAIVMTVQAGPRLFGLPLFGFLGFVSSFVLGVWLLWAVHRAGRGR